MARSIDATKIERIKQATLQMVVEKGFGGASISEIAKLAGVAEGYLYRHYTGKAELVKDLLFQNLNEIVDVLEEFLGEQYSVKEIFEKLLRILFRYANEAPERIKFLYVLMSEYKFTIENVQRERIYNLCIRIREKGIFSGEIEKGIGEEEIFLMGFMFPIQFINLRYKSFFDKTELSENEIIRIMNIYKKILKNKDL
jgi:TetR/AcrR family transcriptional regulator, repressor of fatR-cypB operon